MDLVGVFDHVDVGGGSGLEVDLSHLGALLVVFHVAFEVVGVLAFDLEDLDEVHLYCVAKHRVDVADFKLLDFLSRVVIFVNVVLRSGDVGFDLDEERVNKVAEHNQH
eukprot:CAMPEP_0116980928 /NCGR_PEP_ID=MMETSP0467-20121206/59378_1 /TAXON_ID=283647 /ORGANISM="Mesodinium pulex, Strain SPMC105" /LENGTH=107 /DNA_ID=CAMNT_0004675001 /DNA_START=1861 /DNA_END=2184 /DNA_ORIENTATION=+